jgi:hypothetical protein
MKMFRDAISQTLNISPTLCLNTTTGLQSLYLRDTVDLG